MKTLSHMMATIGKYVNKTDQKNFLALIFVMILQNSIIYYVEPVLLS